MPEIHTGNFFLANTVSAALCQGQASVTACCILGCGEDSSQLLQAVSRSSWQHILLITATGYVRRSTCICQGPDLSKIHRLEPWQSPTPQTWNRSHRMAPRSSPAEAIMHVQGRPDITLLSLHSTNYAATEKRCLNNLNSGAPRPEWSK